MTEKSDGTFKLADPTGEIKRVGIFSDADIANLAAGTIDARKLSINGTDLMDLLQANKASGSATASMSADLQDLPASVSALTSRVASLEGKIDNMSSGANLATSAFEGLNFKVASLESSLAFQASQSAFLLNIINNNPLLSFNASSAAALNIDSLDVKDATVSGTLAVLGRATFSDVGITGKITDGLLAINGLDADGFASINTTAGPLKLQSHGLFGLDILDGKVTIAANGDIKTQGAIAAKKYNVDTADVSAASAGTLIIKAGQTAVDVNTAALTSKSLIFVTPDSPVLIGAKAKDANTFTIKLQKAQAADIKANWWIIN
jgi:hypothetical protein